MLADKIERLYRLYQQGIISPESFERGKAALILEQSETPADTPVIPFGRAYKSYWKNSFRWSGRGTRAEYWWPVLCNTLISWGLSFMAGLTHLSVFVLLSIIFAIATIFPKLAVMVRRAHDLGKSAWFAFLPLVLDLFLIALLLVFAIGGQVVDYATRDNPMETFRTTRSVVFIAGGFMLIICGFWTFIWSLMLSLMPGQPFTNKYGDRQ